MIQHAATVTRSGIVHDYISVPRSAFPAIPTECKFGWSHFGDGHCHVAERKTGEHPGYHISPSLPEDQVMVLFEGMEELQIVEFAGAPTRVWLEEGVHPQLIPTAPLRVLDSSLPDDQIFSLDSILLPSGHVVWAVRRAWMTVRIGTRAEFISEVVQPWYERATQLAHYDKVARARETAAVFRFHDLENALT